MNLETYETYENALDPRFKGPAVEVDEMILPAIALLNKKGYETQFCCSGHLSKQLNRKDRCRLAELEYPYDANETYIMFNVTEEGFNNIKKKLPEGFKIDDWCRKISATQRYYPCIRKSIQCKSDLFGMLEEVYDNCRVLYMMAKKLPNINKRGE